MSTVTNIMLSDDTLMSLSVRGQALITKTLGLVKVDNESVGGTKIFEDDLYLGAFNNLSLAEYVLSVKSCFKGKLDNIQLFIKEQDDDKWREIDLRGRV